MTQNISNNRLDSLVFSEGQPLLVEINRFEISQSFGDVFL